MRFTRWIVASRISTIQFALFPQYAILFGLGCAAGRRGWLETLTPEVRRGCGEHWTRQGPWLRRMAAAAYGAFVIHPPLIVGLALALHRVMIAAELKFVLGVAGAVAGAFGITSLAVRSVAISRVFGSGATAAQARTGRPSVRR